MAKIKIRGFNQHVVVPVVVELEEGDLKFDVTYKRHGREDANKLIKKISKSAERAKELSAKRLEAKESEREEIDGELDKLTAIVENYIRDNVVSWSGLLDADDNEIPFSQDVLDQLFDHPAYYNALDKGVWQATGARIKN